MNMLKNIIQEKDHWRGLDQYIDLIERNRNTSYTNLLLDASKSLIESIINTIIADKQLDIKRDEDLQKKIKIILQKTKPFEELENKNQEATKQIINSLVNIVKQIGFFRNNHGSIAHGRDLQEEIFDRELSSLIIDISKVLAVFLIKTHDKNKQDRKRYYYQNYEKFNSWIDDQEDSIETCGLEIKASLALFKCDSIAYIERFNTFINENEEIIDEFQSEWKNYEVTDLSSRIPFLEDKDLEKIVNYILKKPEKKYKEIKDIILENIISNEIKNKLMTL